MKLHSLILALSIFVLLAQTPALALDPAKPVNHYRYEVWEEAEGLPHYSINSIAQGPEGYLWLATYYGLVRFDGKKFVVFDRNNTPALDTNLIWRLTVDAAGRLWIGTGRGLLFLEDGAFHPVPLPGATGASVRVLMARPNGDVWAGTMEHGAFLIRNGHISAAGPPGQSVRSLLLDRDGDMWFGTNGGLYRNRRGRMEHFGKEEGLPDSRVLSLMEDPAGRLCIGTATGLVRMSNGRFVREHAFDGQVVWVMERDRHDSIWIGTLGAGLARYAGERLEFFDNPRKISSKAVSAIYEDREGSLWLGASGAGLGRLRDVPFRNLTTEDGLAGNLVQTVKAARDGSIWVGLNGGGLAHLSASGKVLHTWTHENGLPSDDIWCLEEDREGGIWMGFYNGILARLFRGRIRLFAPADGMPGQPVVSVMEDRTGAIWAGTMNGGVAVIRRGQIRVYRKRDGLPGNQVRVIRQDGAGRIWLGTDHGVSIFDNDVFQNLGVKDGLSGKLIFAIHEESDGTFWIGAFDGGLTRLRNGRFVSYGPNSGFTAESVFSIVDDGRGAFWISSSSGIFRFEKRELNDFADGKIRRVQGRSYGIAEGMGSRECNGGQPAGDRSLDGRLWFPTMKGLAVVEPDSLGTNALPPPVVIEQLQSDGRIYGGNAPVTLPPGTRNLEMQFTALSLVAPDKVRFRYRLAPFETNWVDGDTRRIAVYSNLQPGTYQFRVMAANNDGVWNETGASLDITLQPRVYQTRLFWSLALTGVIGMVLLLHQVRTRRLRRSNEELEERVADRTRSLEQANLEMSGLVQQLRIARSQAEQASRARSEFIANVSHEIRTPMSGILGMVGLTMETPLTEQQREYLRLTEESAQALMQVLNDVLDFSKIDAGHLSIESEPFDLRSVVEGCIGILAARATAKKLELTCEFDPSVPERVSGDAGRLRQILLNLAGNAIKFTEAGSVRIRSAVQQHTASEMVLWFQVRDTGIGVPKEKQEIIFEPFRQADNSTSRQFGGTGLGLAISARLVQAMKGRIWVESDGAQGSCFHFTITVQTVAPADAPLPRTEEPTSEQMLPLLILLAEDNRINQRVAATLLNRRGCTVEVVENGKQALARTAERNYDLVLMDVQMPVMDGLQAATAIREREKTSGGHMPIVALTAHAMAGDAERCIQAGMDGYLTKPINPKRLAEVLFKIHQQSRATEARSTDDPSPSSHP